MTENKKTDISQIVMIVLLVLLGAYFVVNIQDSKSSYREEITSLEQTRDALEEKLENSVDKDSILYYLEEQGKLESVVSELNKIVDSLKYMNDEEYVDFNQLSIDSNIVILTRYLSE